MKNLIILVFVLPMRLFAQDINGVWAGTLYNDSTQTSTRYEIAVSDKNGKYTAYSYTIFKADNKEVYGVKSLDIVKAKDKIFFKDRDLILDNYPADAPKGVKQISSVKIFDSLSQTFMSGTFITTKSGKYGRPVTGRILLVKTEEQSKDVALTKLLIKNGVASTLAFVSGDVPLKIERVKNDNDKLAAKEKETKRITSSFVTEMKPIEKLPASVQKQTFAEALAARKIETIQTIEFTSDSLRLELYDNGTIDGDSVSVIVNGKVVMEHQLLSAKAISKTVYADRDSLKVVMFAENLGSIAPNTGLLIVYDGTKRYEISFSGDLTKNSAILFKRRR